MSRNSSRLPEISIVNLRPLPSTSFEQRLEITLRVLFEQQLDITLRALFEQRLETTLRVLFEQRLETTLRALVANAVPLEDDGIMARAMWK